MAVVKQPARIIVTGLQTVVALHTYVSKATRSASAAATVITIPEHAHEVVEEFTSSPVYLVGLHDEMAANLILKLGALSAVQPIRVEPHHGQPGYGLHILPWLKNPIFVLPTMSLLARKGLFKPAPRLGTPGFFTASEPMTMRPGFGGARAAPAVGMEAQDWAFRWIQAFEEAGADREVAISMVAHIAIECGWGKFEREHNPGFLVIYEAGTPYFQVPHNARKFQIFPSDKAFVTAYFNTLRGHSEGWDALHKEPTSDKWYLSLGWYSSPAEIKAALPTYHSNRQRIVKMLQ